MSEGSRSLSADLVVIGGGGAGLMAAAEGGRLGKEVCVIEKADAFGGTTSLAVGSIMAAGTSLQRKIDVQDSPAEHARDLAEVCERLGLSDNAELRDVYT